MSDKRVEITMQEFIDQVMARLAALEERQVENARFNTQLAAALRAMQERELMFFSEIENDDPEVGKYLREMRDRVLSYPIDGESSS